MIIVIVVGNKKVFMNNECKVWFIGGAFIKCGLYFGIFGQQDFHLKGLSPDV